MRKAVGVVVTLALIPILTSCRPTNSRTVVVYVSEENEPDYRHAGLDISLATAHQGRGYGREALRVAIDHLVRERGHHRFTIDPAADNEVAIRSYAAVGFKPVGVLRRYERAPDGTWRDGLLMDLLADELP